MNKIRSNIEEGDNNTFSIEISSYNEGNKIMLDCPGLGLYKENYLFDSIISSEMIWVKFHCPCNELYKVPSTSCNLTTYNITTRKRKLTDFYRPGATVAENFSSYRRNTSDSRAVRYGGRIVN